MGFRGGMGKKGTGGGRKSIEDRLARYGDTQRQKSKATKEKKAEEKTEEKTEES